MKPANLWELDDRAQFWRLHFPAVRRILPKGKMRARGMIVVEVAEQNPTQVAFGENDDMVETLTPDGPDHTFDIWTLPRGTWRNENLPDTEGLGAARELVTEDPVAIADQVVSTHSRRHPAWTVEMSSQIPVRLVRRSTAGLAYILRYRGFYSGTAGLNSVDQYTAS